MERALPDEVSVKRSDPVYNAHAYLTKVPISAIEPFLEAFTKPGDLVLDLYGGSGMTGVAAAICGRRGEIRDISVLGQHIGANYLNLVEPDLLRRAAAGAIERAVERHGDLYSVPCSDCGEDATLSRTVWSTVFACSHCGEDVIYHESLKEAAWSKPEMTCGSCGESFTARGSRRVAEVPVIDTISCACSKRLRDVEHVDIPLPPKAKSVAWPSVEIGADRQMFHASALKKHGRLTTDSFFSQRNLIALGGLWDAISEVEEVDLVQKLRFSFTAILTRASKRYQWHPKRPLNAANQNYYVAPVFYEWNVHDLFRRKVDAAIRSDAYIRSRMKAHGVDEPPEVDYELGSADAVDLADASVDYVFTDPPFGSNIFYSDMNLFQEAWLGSLTDDKSEAVVDRTGVGARDAGRYERILLSSFREAARVLKPEGWLSVVFSNSSGAMWATLQRAVRDAGFTLEEVTLLNKGQRSVKGLASGFEKVVTVDLVLSMKKASVATPKDLRNAPPDGLFEVLEEVLGEGRVATPSHLYLEVVRRYLKSDWDVADVHIHEVMEMLGDSFEVDFTTGRFLVGDEVAA